MLTEDEEGEVVRRDVSPALWGIVMHRYRADSLGRLEREADIERELVAGGAQKLAARVHRCWCRTFVGGERGGILDATIEAVVGMPMAKVLEIGTGAWVGRERDDGTTGQKRTSRGQCQKCRCNERTK